MKWITREDANVDRIACPWLIKRFVDPQAEFLYVPREQVMEVAKRAGVPRGYEAWESDEPPATDAEAAGLMEELTQALKR